MPRPDISEPQCLFDVDELACGCASKAMHATSVDIQSIATLAHNTFKIIFPLMVILVIKIHKAARKI